MSIYRAIITRINITRIKKKNIINRGLESMLRNALIVIMSIVFVSSVKASGVDFRISSETAELVFLTESATFGYGGADMGFGLFINENDDLMGTGSVLVSGSGDGDVRGLHFGVGAKVYVGILDFPVDNQEGAALSIGGQVRYVFPAKMPFAILFEGFVAPGVTSASDFEGLKEFRGALELEVTPSARAYIGYRTLEVELDSGAKIELDEEVHVGVRFSF